MPVQLQRLQRRLLKKDMQVVRLHSRLPIYFQKCAGVVADDHRANSFLDDSVDISLYNQGVRGALFTAG